MGSTPFKSEDFHKLCAEFRSFPPALSQSFVFVIILPQPSSTFAVVSGDRSCLPHLLRSGARHVDWVFVNNTASLFELRPYALWLVAVGLGMPADTSGRGIASLV